MPQFESKIAGKIKISEDIFADLRGKIKNIADFKIVIERLLGEETTELAAALLSGGILLEASDLHIEPEAEQSKLRIRVDGILQDVMLFDQKVYQKLLSRIKLLSGIKLNITDKPQDGRFSILLTGTSIEIRTSTLPAEYGESIVLRILNPKTLIQVEDLGLRRDLLELFKKEINKPNGMIIVTGPTGSGKTTTLYAFLNIIKKPEIKIITIEDPIEYHLEGISQTQVAPEKGYDFASGLRSIVRQDPDVILVGEIRDLETAQIALQAALTGHLVLTTLHTNDAAGTIARLQALGEKPVNIAPAINVTIAQRLVRKVCKKCRKLILVPPALSKKIKDILKELPVGVKIPNLASSFKIPQAQVKGCQECNFTGYRGRVGIFEAFLIDDELEKFILTAPSISDLRERAIRKGMITMHQDGVIKVLEEITTLEEVERVTGE
jgi:type II secretory ATPase GspE/PulE/Tfp pilus assembly ATPase PilB-like protein